MNMLEPSKSRFEVFWPNIFTDAGRRLARNEGIAALICFIGQYVVRLDNIYLKMESGALDLEFYKTVYLCALIVLVFLTWRVFKWERVSSVFALLIAIFELVAVSINYVPGSGLPVWNAIMTFLAVQGVRGCFAHNRNTLPNT